MNEETTEAGLSISAVYNPGNSSWRLLPIVVYAH